MGKERSKLERKSKGERRERGRRRKIEKTERMREREREDTRGGVILHEKCSKTALNRRKKTREKGEKARKKG